MKRGAGIFAIRVLRMAVGFFAGLSAGAEENAKPVVIAVDVGHTLEKPGATSARGRTEFEFNVDMARKVKTVLEQRGFRAFLINESGASIGLADRPALAAKEGANLLVSIHHDAVNDKYYRDWEFEGRPQRYSDAFRGYSVFFSEKNPRAMESRMLAELIGQAMREQGFTPTHHHAEPIAGENRPLVDPDRGVYHFADLVVLKRAEIPAVLVECGVIVHREEETALRDPKVQDRIAIAIAEGITRLVRAEESQAAGAEPAPSDLASPAAGAK
jgi:N-acetylmuramoyl-L-alanine amidase